MAFSTSHVAKISAILEFVIIISAIVNGVSSSWQEFNGPLALVRLKRAPQRAFTFSGFNPNNGITALATSADYFPPYYNYQSLSSQYGYASGRGQSELESLPAPPSPPSSTASDTASSDYFPDYQRPTSEYPSADPNSDGRSSPPANLTPPSEEAFVTNYNLNSATQPKKYNKKPAKLSDDEDDEDDGRSKSKSTSSASFNAWFPIVLGMYPSRGNGPSTAYKEDAENVPSKNQYPDRYTDRELGNTVIANSVSHGKSSVASSHAIAYGGRDPPMKSYRKDNY